VRFGELADARDLTVTGYSADAVRINLRVPPDLFMWNSKGVPIDLRYRFTVRPAPDRSSLNISVNDGFVQAMRIPAVSSSAFDLGRYFTRVLPDKTADARRQIYIPPLLLTPRSQLRMHFFYDIPNTRECRGRLLENVVGSIDPNSTIDVSSFPHFMALPDLAAFANSGFPFTRLADLSETAVILPNDPGSSDYSLFLLEMGRMGASTGYPVTDVTVASAEQVDRFASKDLLILGAPGRQPLLQRWAKSMPFSSDGDTRTFELSDVVFKLEDWWHGVQGVERMPARADLSLVSANGDALISGFESPLQKSRSAVALVSGAPRRRRAAADSRRDGRDPRPHGDGDVERQRVLRRLSATHPVPALGAVVASSAARAGRPAGGAHHRRAVLPYPARDRRATSERLICRSDSRRDLLRSRSVPCR
jgi:hypothetical protein